MDFHLGVDLLALMQLGKSSAAQPHRIACSELLLCKPLYGMSSDIRVLGSEWDS